MLGRLAHWLRAMGYDTVYLGPADDSRLLDVARREARILVTSPATRGSPPPRAIWAA
jgi:uncharacterized protein with PIN domain